MKRAFFALLFLPALLAAKPKPPQEQVWMDANLARAGGLPKFQRLETFSCRFEETVKTSSGTAVSRGRWVLRFNGGKDLRLREDVDGGAVTVVLSTAAAGSRGRDLLREVFWTFAPQWVSAEERPLRMLSSGFLSHRLLERVSVEGAPFFPGGDPLIFYINGQDGLMAGAASGAAAEPVSFHNFEATQGFLTLPSVRVYYDGAGKQTRMVKLSNVVVNGYVDEKLFTQE